VQLGGAHLLRLARALEAGLARLARTGYIRPVRKDNLSVRLDEPSRTADVSIRIEEIGRQRVSLVGGHAAFGITVGIAYTVFDLLGGEELLTMHLEGGPATLLLLFGIAKEGFFGSPSSLTLSVFRSFVRPRLATNPNPLFTLRSTGLDAGWTYAVSPATSRGVIWDLSPASTR
jgi:outer membrane protein assembly factor BamA